jgi:hypothetical protein
LKVLAGLVKTCPFGGNLALPILLSFAFGVDRVERNNLQSNEETVPNLDASRPPEMDPISKVDD